MPRLHSIRIEVEEVAVGHLMRVLHHTPGVAKVHYDLEHSGGTSSKQNGVAHPNKGRPRKEFGVTGHEFVLAVLMKAGKPLHIAELAKAFEDSGRAPTSANSAIHITNMKKLTKSTPAGYMLTKTGRQHMRRVAAKEA
ncbi:MAG TPA: hypothetical protein VF748_07475 [Candidatus Acidoferrum sp.]